MNRSGIGPRRSAPATNNNVLALAFFRFATSATTNAHSRILPSTCSAHTSSNGRFSRFAFSLMARRIFLRNRTISTTSRISLRIFISSFSFSAARTEAHPARACSCRSYTDRMTTPCTSGKWTKPQPRLQVPILIPMAKQLIPILITETISTQLIRQDAHETSRYPHGENG